MTSFAVYTHFNPLHKYFEYPDLRLPFSGISIFRIPPHICVNTALHVCWPNKPSFISSHVVSSIYRYVLCKTFQSSPRSAHTTRNIHSREAIVWTQPHMCVRTLIYGSVRYSLTPAPPPPLPATHIVCAFPSRRGRRKRPRDCPTSSYKHWAETKYRRCSNRLIPKTDVPNDVHSWLVSAHSHTQPFAHVERSQCFLSWPEYVLQPVRGVLVAYIFGHPTRQTCTDTFRYTMYTHILLKCRYRITFSADTHTHDSVTMQFMLPIRVEEYGWEVPADCFQLYAIFR